MTEIAQNRQKSVISIVVPSYFQVTNTIQPAFTWSKLTKGTLEQGVKYVQN